VLKRLSPDFSNIYYSAFGRETLARLATSGVLLGAIGTPIGRAGHLHMLLRCLPKNRDLLLEGDTASRFLAATLADPKVKSLLSNGHFSVGGRGVGDAGPRFRQAQLGEMAGGEKHAQTEVGLRRAEGAI
jgi:hypothetical protein